ncbi:MAG: NADH-quinone oxidoreductase subunit N [Micromonosporaceae bacterium]
MKETLVPLLPEVILAGAAVTGLLAGSWLPRRRQWAVQVLAAAACLAAMAATGVLAAQPATTDFAGAYTTGTVTALVRVVVLTATLLVIAFAPVAIRAHPRESEFYVLVLLAALGTITMAGATDLLTLFAAYLLASTPAYPLAGFLKDGLGTEAALKYYLMGALSGVFMLTGVTLLYGARHATSYTALPAGLAAGPHAVAAAGLIGILAGLLFKAGAAPVQFWVPDVTDGTSIPVAAFVTTIPKIGALAALARLLSTAIPVPVVNWPVLIAILAAATMTLGNLAAFFQDSVKRLLAYSTISQAGYLLIPVAVATRTHLAAASLLFYLAAYAVTNLGAFAVVAEFPRAATLRDYAGLARRHPGLAAVLLVCLLGLVGTPPTAVFLGKLEIFTAAIDGGYSWLAALAVANTVASLFYYLRWLIPAFLLSPARPSSPALRPAGHAAAITAYAAGTASLALGIAGGAILPLLTGQPTP